MLANPDGISGSGSGGHGYQEGEVFQQLSQLQSTFENTYAKLLAVNNSQALADANTHTSQLIDNATDITR